MINGGLRTKEIVKASHPNSPLITIVTVVYNGINELEKTILSVINQTYMNFEYLVIDGASTDGTLDIIKKYEDRIDYWQSEPDKGIYDAMNKAIDLSTGDYINFMNCGDIFADDKVLENVVKNTNSKNYDLIYGNVINKWNVGDELKKVDTSKVMGFCHQSAFTSTNLLKKYKFDLSYKICADRNFYKQINDNEIIRKLYIDIPIAIFECENSLSVDNNLISFKENARIQNISKGKYFIGIIKVHVKDFVIRFFPKLIDYYRKRRIQK